MRIQKNISLAEYNWFETGGPASLFTQPQDSNEFGEALQHARKVNLPVFVLGEGANVLIADDGYSGLVIHSTNSSAEIISSQSDEHTVLVRAGSGMSVHDLIDFCLDHNLTGLEVFSGIPGTVGGAVYINLHYFDALLSDFFVRGRVIHQDGEEIHWEDREWFDFGYDRSRLHQGEYLLTEAEFRLQQATDLEIAYAKGSRDEIIHHRNRRYPTSHTCGSFFRNFFPEEVTLRINGRPMIYIAYYLDKLGVKGALSVGGASVSTKHANMIVTKNSATSNDVIRLARRMQKLVLDEFGIIPQPECQMIGFEKYPLLK